MYVKKYNEKGELINPITRKNPFLNTGDNRRKRREPLQKTRFIGNVKHVSLSVIGTYKYKRIVQVVDKKEIWNPFKNTMALIKVGGKRILHQVPA